MATQYLVVAGFVVLLAASVPIPRVRRWVLTVGQLVSAVAVPLVVLSAGVVHVGGGSLPDAVRSVSDGWVAGVGRQVPSATGFEWPLTALVAVLVGVPVTAGFEFARRLAGISATFAKVRHDFRPNVSPFVPSAASPPRRSPPAAPSQPAAPGGTLTDTLFPQVPHGK